MTVGVAGSAVGATAAIGGKEGSAATSGGVMGGTGVDNAPRTAVAGCCGLGSSAGIPAQATKNSIAASTTRHNPSPCLYFLITFLKTDPIYPKFIPNLIWDIFAINHRA
jgi:hypothetical protein